MHTHDASVVWCRNVCLSTSRAGCISRFSGTVALYEQTKLIVNNTMASNEKSSKDIMEGEEHLNHETAITEQEKPARSQNIKEQRDFQKKTLIKESQIRKEGKEKRIALTTGEAALGDLSPIEDEEEQSKACVEDEDNQEVQSPDLTSHGPVFDDDKDGEALQAQPDGSTAFPFAVRRPNAPQPASRDYDSDGYEKNRPRPGKGLEEGEVPDEELEMEHPFKK